MKRQIDQEADALYLRLDESPVIESEEAAPGLVVDFDANNRVVGVEILGLSRRASKLDLSKLVFETLSGPETRTLGG